MTEQSKDNPQLTFEPADAREEIGRLTLVNGVFHFEGDVDRSAEIFLDCLNDKALGFFAQIRNEVCEEAAQLCEHTCTGGHHEWDAGYDSACRSLAGSIRALKEGE